MVIFKEFLSKIGNRRGNKKVKPVYEDNSDCVLLYACGWQVVLDILLFSMEINGKCFSLGI